MHMQMHMQCARRVYAVHMHTAAAYSGHRRIGSVIALGTAIARCCALRCARGLHRRMPEQRVVTTFLLRDEGLATAEGGAR